MKKLMMLAALGAFVAAAPAFAKDKTPAEKDAKVSRAISESDTDNDGKLSKAEWTAKSDAKFAEADADKDGFVTKGEKLAAMEKQWAGKK